jgi:hypothetical protein
MSEQNMQLEQHPDFPSGEWEGFYTYGASTRNDEMKLELEFANGEIVGSGTDSIGAFSWDGTYNTSTGECQLTKRYIRKHNVAYEGKADEGGIRGNWRIGVNEYDDGFFHIWPKDREAAEIEEAIRKLIEAVNKTLEPVTP